MSRRRGPRRGVLVHPPRPPGHPAHPPHPAPPAGGGRGPGAPPPPPPVLPARGRAGAADPGGISKTAATGRLDYAELAKSAVSVLENRYYTGAGTWNMCVPAICNVSNYDWGADSLTYSLYFDWQLTQDPQVAALMTALAGTSREYDLTGSDWSDAPEWDAVRREQLDREAGDAGDPDGERAGPAMVLGETLEAARVGAAAIAADGVEYQPLPAIITLTEAISAGTFQGAALHVRRGDVDGALATSTHVFTGEIEFAGQEHFYLETNAALAHVEARARDLAQPRPEYGHATNALCIIGPRANTRGLYLDRRSFLVSYDAAADPHGGPPPGLAPAALPVLVARRP